MPPTFTPYSNARSEVAPNDSDAYLRVRVAGERRTDGSVLVYLPCGTGLVVAGDQLLRLDEVPPVARP